MEFFLKCIDLLEIRWSEVYFRQLISEYFNSNDATKYADKIQRMSMILFMHVRRQGYKITERWT